MAADPTQKQTATEDGLELIVAGAQRDTPDSGEIRKLAPAAAAWPSGRVTPREELPIQGDDVARVAEFGPPPSSFIATPLYALRVFQRQRTIRDKLVDLDARSCELEAKCEELLAELANELLPTLQASEAFQRVLEPLRAVERLDRERLEALTSADVGLRRQVERFDTEIAELRSTQAQAESLVTERKGVLEQAEAAFRRADAKHKRALIEIRASVDVARLTLGPEDAIPPAQAAQIAELEAKARAMEPEVLRLRTAPSFAQQELKEAEASLKVVLTSLKKVEGEKALAIAAIEKKPTLGADAIPGAGQQKREALVQVGRAVLAMQGGVTIRTELIETLRVASLAQERAAIQAETHRRALDSHDRRGADRGFQLACGLVGAVALLILLKAVF